MVQLVRITFKMADFEPFEFQWHFTHGLARRLHASYILQVAMCSACAGAVSDVTANFKLAGNEQLSEFPLVVYIWLNFNESY